MVEVIINKGEIEMENWEKEIRKRVDDYNKKRAEVSTLLSTLLLDLKVSPYNLDAKSDIARNNELLWEVEIEKKKFSISYDEIKEKQIIKEVNASNIIIDTGKRKELKEALIDLILEKFDI